MIVELPGLRRNSRGISICFGSKKKQTQPFGIKLLLTWEKAARIFSSRLGLEERVVKALAGCLAHDIIRKNTADHGRIKDTISIRERPAEAKDRAVSLRVIDRRFVDTASLVIANASPFLLN